MSILQVNHVKRIYSSRLGGNEVEALADVNFSVDQGEYVAIMGESGSGKTTLLNILAALDKPTSGEVVLDGQKIEQIPENELSHFRRNNLGFVFQDFNLLDNFSLKDNIFLPMVLSGSKHNEMEQRIKPIAQDLGIQSLLDKYPYEVSGMFYRMKKNGIGLANICIMSVGTIILLSIGISMFISPQDQIDSQYPSDAFAEVILEDNNNIIDKEI